MLSHFNLRTLAVLTCLTASSAFAASGGKKTRIVGVGLAYASANQATVVNPSLFHESDKLALEGLWQFEANEPFVSVASGQGNVGFGASWEYGGSSNHFGGGFSVGTSNSAFGAALRTTDFEGVDGDLGFTSDFSKVRCALIIRGLNSGVDRIDLGIGFEVGQLLVGLDVKKPWPLDSDAWFFDATLGVGQDKLSAAFGLDMSLLGGEFDANIHAGLAFAATNNLAIEAHYRFLAQEFGAPDFTAGVRATF